METLYNLLPAQQQFIHVPNRDQVGLDVACYQGGMGSGKSFIGAFLDIELCAKYPGIWVLVGALTYPMVRDTTMVSIFEHLDAYGFIPEKHYQFRKQEGKIIFPQWGNSTILFRHLDDPIKLKSLNLGAAHLEEMSELPEATFHMVISRLRQSGIPLRRLYGTTNPEMAPGWMTEIFQKGNRIIQKEVNGQIVSIQYRRVMTASYENIHLDPAYLLGMEELFDEEYYNINVKGQDPDVKKGLVVYNWSIANEDRFVSYDPDYSIYVGCDFNIDPNCWVLAHRVRSESGKAEYHFFDEICLPDTTTVEAAEVLAQRYKGHDNGIIITGDASGDNRRTEQSKANETNYQIILNTLSMRGFRNVSLDVPSLNPPVQERVNTFTSLVKSTLGDVRIRINPEQCPKLYWNMLNLKYVEGTNVIYEPSRQDIKRDITHKLKYTKHPFDAASYITHRYDAIKREDGFTKIPRIKTIGTGRNRY